MAVLWIFSETTTSTKELLGLGRELISAVGGSITVLMGPDGEGREEWAAYGADEIILLPPLADGLAMEAHIPVIAAAAAEEKPDIILLPATARGREMAPRLAQRLDTGLCSNCVAVRWSGGDIEMDRVVYGGAAIQTVKFLTRPVMATVAPKTFSPPVPEEGRSARLRELPPLAAGTVPGVRIVEKREKRRLARDLTQAKVVVAAGRGLEKKEDLALVEEFASLVGGEVGCTRPLSEELHWLPTELCIGLSGVSVKPDLYIGVGVSGQVQHMTGVRGAKVIAAVNRDENAPIFAQADLGIVGDLYEALPKLITALKK